MSKGKINSNNFFASTDLSDDQARSIWLDIKKAVEEIQNGNSSKLRYEEQYRKAYTLVLHKKGDMLYNGVIDCVKTRLLETSRIVSSAKNETLLEVIKQEWDSHKKIMGILKDILMYMDKIYCKTAKKLTVMEKGLELFRDHVIRNQQVTGRLCILLQDLVTRERNGELVDRQLMKNVLAMLVEVTPGHRTDLYVELFEKEFLEQTSVFYRQESQDFMAKNTIPDYLRKIEKRLQEEEDRSENYLYKCSKMPLREVVQKELIVTYASRLVADEQSGFVVMLSRNMIDDLERMYMFFSRVPNTLQLMRDAMSKLVQEIGTKIVQEQETLKNPTLFVQQILDTRAQFENYLQKPFKGDRNFSKVLKDALETVVTMDSRAAQYLSLYIDDLLRKQVKSMSAQDIETSLDNVITIFRYLQDKDVFEDFYKQHLCSRLLTGQSINADVERSVIAKLKHECGHQFTSKLEGMFKDMITSKSVMKGFKSMLASQSTKSPDLSVTVLTTGFWPIAHSVPCALPLPAQRLVTAFTKYYTTQHSGTRLSWQTNLGTAELRCSFNSGRKELLVTTYQMCILLLFNQTDTFTYDAILQNTQIPEKELRRQLLSLAHPKVRVLRKSPNSKSIEPTHTFTYNMDYESKLRRVKIPLLAAAPVKQEVVPPVVVEARKNRVDAALVRIMKARKQLNHYELTMEVMKQLSARFAVEPQFIKKRIESLIEREYLERDKSDRRLYNYVA